MKEKKNERCIEVKFNSAKEKIFIFMKPYITPDVYHQILNLFDAQSNSKIYLLPTDYVESVKVIKDTKDRKYLRWIRFLKKDIAKGLEMREEELFGKKKEEEYISGKLDHIAF